MNQVPEDGNCTAAGPHLIPYDGPPDNFTCDTSAMNHCQVGDLSGKHGKMVPENGKFNAAYTDDYASTANDSPAFFGNRSLVVHNSTGARINCGNFILQANATGPSQSTNATSTPSSSSSTSHATESASSTGISSSPTDGAAPPSQSSSGPGEYPGNSGSTLDGSYSLLASLGMIGLVAAMWL
jgi:hypothetical protein